MPSHMAIAERIIHRVRANAECSLEELMHRLQDLSWPEVFLEIDR